MSTALARLAPNRARVHARASDRRRTAPRGLPSSRDDADAAARVHRRAVSTALALAPFLVAPRRARAEDFTECFFDIAVEGQPLGRIVVAVDEGTLSGRRFVELARGVGGLSYRRTTVDNIEVSGDGDDAVEIYLKNNGVEKFVTPGSDASVDVVGGPSAERLLPDLGKRSHDERGLVSLIVRRDPSEPEPEPKARLVSVRGKFETVYDPPPPPPNGTGFTITLRAAPELDATNVVVGRVVSGDEVLDEISQLPTVKDNTSSPFFAVAKSIGDKRALVAEQAFRKPFRKVQFMKCGVVAKSAPASEDEAPQ